MKTNLLLSISFSMLLLSTVQAQTKFYVGVTGGLNRSYSDYMVHTYNNEFYSTPKGGQQLGLKFGFNLLNQKFQLESGFSYSKYGMLFRYNHYPEVFPEFYLTYNTIEIPLFIKVNLTKPDKKFLIQGILGIAYILKPSDYEGYKIEFKNNPSFKSDTSYSYTHGGLPAELKVKVKADQGVAGDNRETILYKAGLGLVYNLNERISINASGMFQMSNVILFAAEADYIHTTQYFPYTYQRKITATSKADALTFNIGLNYHFGKRKPKE